MVEMVYSDTLTTPVDIVSDRLPEHCFHIFSHALTVWYTSLFKPQIRKQHACNVYATHWNDEI